MLNKKVVVKYTTDGFTEYSLKEQVEDVKLGEHDVLVKIHSCSLSLVREKTVKQFSKATTEGHYPVGHEISGTVESIGSEVTLCKSEDDVASFLPISSEYSGCGTYCILSEFDIAVKPDKVSHVDAACCIGDAVKAYTAFLYQAKITSGETVVVTGAASGYGIIATQLAQFWGAKVIVSGSTDEELTFLKSLEPPADQVVDLRNKRKDILSVCLEETGGVGVDCFLDNGVERYPDEFSDNLQTSKKKLLTKHQVISSLAVGGRWITTQHDLQVDPPDSELLSLKCASIHYLFEYSWTLSRGAQGRYLHILNDVMKKLSKGVIRPTVHHTILLDDCINSLNQLEDSTIGKIVVKI